MSATTNTTVKDVYLLAHAAAVQICGTTSEYELETKKLSEFALSGLDPLDYPKFNEIFTDRLSVLASLSSVQSVSAVTAAKNAAAAQAFVATKPATQAA